MFDKISLINAVWMTVIAGMLTATVALYEQKTDAAKVYNTYNTARASIVSEY
ncbi:hypothetical protein [Oryzifoliimicrobium ureilyticus]|uniref:hypothetical protein n=1 Tax=Oryzifoliimicrobium ureilyticus TaxID=3113724 RepID=UPI0030762E97